MSVKIEITLDTSNYTQVPNKVSEFSLTQKQAESLYEDLKKILGKTETSTTIQFPSMQPSTQPFIQPYSKPYYPDLYYCSSSSDHVRGESTLADK